MALSFHGELSVSGKQMCFLQGCRGPGCSWNANQEKNLGLREKGLGKMGFPSLEGILNSEDQLGVGWRCS